MRSHEGFLSDFFKHLLSVKQNFILLDGKLNDLKTDAEDSRFERFELLTRSKGVAINANPDAMWH